MKIKTSSYFLIFVLVAMLFVISQAITYRLLEAKLLLLLVAGVTLVFGITELVHELRSEDGRETAVQKVKPQEQIEIPSKPIRLASTMAWVAGVCLLSYLVGFLLAIPLFSFLYLKARGRGWLTATVFSVIVTASVYVIFEIGFKFYLYRGLLFDLF